MTTPSLPVGRYLVAFNQVRTVAGGQTHSLLQRTWLFAEQQGVASSIVTFDPFPDYSVVQADLRSRQKLHPRVELRNIYDYYADCPWHGPDATSDRSATGSPVASLEHLRRVTEVREGGSLWRTRYEDPVNLQPVLYDYHRADGSTYLRTPPLSMDELKEEPGLIQAIDEHGQVVRAFSSLGEWYTSWVHELTDPDDEVFLFYDSMMLPPHLAPRLSTRIHQLATMHMAHVYPPRRWNSPQHGPARRSLEQLSRFEGFVILTQRQREDVELYYGRRSNLFVLPNPGQPVDVPNPVPARDPKRLVVVARLERVKRVDHAIRAFALVLNKHPDAKLDVYGEGRQRQLLLQLVDKLGLHGSVTLHGHRPDARDRLWECSGLLLTSRSEGFPLATLESFARGCPVVSYDLKYGPREQIEDGVTGYLAPPGDIETLAAKATRLLDSPTDVARMGEAARERVQHDLDTYVDRWAAILRAVGENRARRTELRRMRLEIEALGPGTRRGRMARGRIRFRGQLHAETGQTRIAFSEADVRLEAVNDADGTIVPLPLSVTFDKGDRVALESSFSLRRVVSRVPAQSGSLRLRLRVTWENSYWETDLGRPAAMAPIREAAFLDDGAIRLRFRRRRSAGGPQSG